MNYTAFRRLAVLCLGGFLFTAATPAHAAPALALSEQYTFAGAISEWYAEESYYAAPVVVDLDGDGRLEVVNAAHALTVMDAATGAIKWRVNSGRDRSTEFAHDKNQSGQVFCDVQVRDVDGDGMVEIAVGYADGTVSLLNNAGYFKSGWPQKALDVAVRSIVVEDLNGDGMCEIAVGYGVADSTSVWLYRADGTVASGWPQLSAGQNANITQVKTETAYGYGVFGNGMTAGDLDGDGKNELLVPTDTPYISAFRADGALVDAAPAFDGRTWGKVAVWEDNQEELACENEGWGWGIKGGETRAQLYRAELGHAAAVCADVDGDGKTEVALTALMVDRTNPTRTDLVTIADTRYMTVLLLNGDRTRYQNPSLGYDWRSIPVDLGGPLRKNDPESVATGVMSEPVCADLNGDGTMEILFTAYNGKLHCFDLNQKETGAWPFVMPQTSSSCYEYATTPVCADLNGDGYQEVIFASWTANEQGANTGVNGALYVTDHTGKLLVSTALHNGYATYEGVVNHSNNVFATPTVADVDGDGKYEILLNTTYYGLCAYEVSAAAPVARAASAAVRVDGKAVSLSAYALTDANGNETSYVRLRDVASLLDGTKAGFDVGWDGSVTVKTASPYTTRNGSELTAPFTGDRAYVVSTAPTQIDGVAAPLDAILLKDNAGNGYTYYKLRDLGKALGFNVRWDQSAGAILVESDQPYTG